MNVFEVSYVTTLPKEGNAPSVRIKGETPHKYTVLFYEYNRGLVYSGVCETNQTIIGKTKQWFTEWLIVVQDESGMPVFHEFFNPEGKTISIKMDAYALGDNIAWMPYIEAFRVKYNCILICSTFYNNLFIENYPKIIFVRPNTVIENIYAQYYIGASDDGNLLYSPLKTSEIPLQSVASSILGLDYEELNPRLEGKYKFSHKSDKKFVTLSEFGSFGSKGWKAENGWQSVVDFINSRGYEVRVISKEATNLINVDDATGEYSLDARAVDILNAKFHIGISSGLSWLAWGLGKHVVMISDVTPNFHEFQSNITRINANDLKRVDYGASGVTKVENVLQILGDLLV